MWRDDLESVVSVHLGDMSDRELASELHRIGSALQTSSGSGEEEHWEERQDALKRLEFLASEDLSQRSNIVSLLQQYIRIPMQQHIEDVRSSLSRAACAVVVSLATYSSVANDSVWLAISDWFVQPLLNCTATTTTVVTEAAKQALHAIFCYAPVHTKSLAVGASSTPVPRAVSSAAFQALLNGCLMKHTTARYTAYAYLFHVLLNYGEAATSAKGDLTLNVDMIFKNMKPLERALRRGLSDASAETRRYARLGFWALEGIDSATVERMYKSLEEVVRRALDRERPAFLSWWDARKQGSTSEECDKIAVDVILGAQWQRFVPAEGVKREMIELKESSFNGESANRRPSTRNVRSASRRQSRGRTGLSVERSDLAAPAASSQQPRDIVTSNLANQLENPRDDMAMALSHSQNSKSLQSYNPHSDEMLSAERHRHAAGRTPSAQRGHGGGQGSGFVSPMTPPSAPSLSQDSSHLLRSGNVHSHSPHNKLLDTSNGESKYRLHGSNSNQQSPIRNSLSSPLRSPIRRAKHRTSVSRIKDSRPKGVTSPSGRSIVSPARQQVRAQRAAQAVAAASPFPVTTEEEWALACGALRSTLWSDRLSGVLRLTASITNLPHGYLHAGADVLIPRLCDPHFRVSIAALDCLEAYLQVTPESFEDHIQDLLSNLLSNLSSNKQTIRDTSRLLLHEVMEVFPLEIIVQTLYLVIDDVVTQRVKISALEYLLYLIQEHPNFSSHPTTMKVAINYLVGQLTANTGKSSNSKNATSGVAIVRGFTNAGAMSRGHTHELRKAVLSVLATLYSVAHDTFVSAILNLPSVEMQSIVQMLTEAIPHLPQECRRRLEGDRPLSHPSLHIPSPFADALYRNQLQDKNDSGRSTARTQTGPRSPRQQWGGGGGEGSRVRSMSGGGQSHGYLEDTYNSYNPDSVESSGRRIPATNAFKSSAGLPQHRTRTVSKPPAHHVPGSAHAYEPSRSEYDRFVSPGSLSASTYSENRKAAASNRRIASRRSVGSPTSGRAPSIGSGRVSRPSSRSVDRSGHVGEHERQDVDPNLQVSPTRVSPIQAPPQQRATNTASFPMDVWLLLDAAKTTSEKMHALDIGLHALNELAKVWQEKFADIMGRIGVLAQEASERDHHVRARAVRLICNVVRASYLYRLVAASLTSFVTLSRTSLDDSFNEVRYEGALLLMELATVNNASNPESNVVARFPYDLFITALLYSVEHFMTTQKQRFGSQMALAMASKGWLEHIREIGRTFLRMMDSQATTVDSVSVRSGAPMVRIVQEDSPHLGNTSALISERLVQRLTTLLVQCLHHDVPEVRKEVIVVIVDMWRALGNGLLPYLVRLTSSQRKLVSVYYNKVTNEDSQRPIYGHNDVPKDLGYEMHRLGLTE